MLVLPFDLNRHLCADGEIRSSDDNVQADDDTAYQLFSTLEEAHKVKLDLDFETEAWEIDIDGLYWPAVDEHGNRLHTAFDTIEVI